MKYRIADIIVGDRKRELGDISQLAQSIQELGLINPITLLPDGTLVAGRHRLAACESLEWEEIDVSIAELDQLHAELAEIDENIVRSELHWTERDSQLARRKVIYEAIYPETKKGNSLGKTLSRIRQEVKPNGAVSLPVFTEDTANKSGLSRDTIERSIQRAEAFTDDQMEALKEAEVTQTEATRIARLPEPEREETIKLVSRGVPAALLTSETNEWFTPPQYVDMARELMGGIDLDPASNPYANEKVQAKTFYDIQTNGLDKEWHGRVWLNPPYGRDEGGSNQEAWSRRLIEQFEAGITKEAVLLVNANTEAKWFQPLYNYPICFTNHRIRFYNTEGTSSQPTQGNAFIYFGTRPERFVELFSTFGAVIRRIDK